LFIAMRTSVVLDHGFRQFIQFYNAINIEISNKMKAPVWTVCLNRA
jgi:hypothetical protein